MPLTPVAHEGHPIAGAAAFAYEEAAHTLHSPFFACQPGEMLAVGLSDGFLPQDSRDIVKVTNSDTFRRFGRPCQRVKFTFEQTAWRFTFAAQHSNVDPGRGSERPSILESRHLNHNGADGIWGQGGSDVRYRRCRGFVANHQDFLGTARTPSQADGVNPLDLGAGDGNDKPIANSHGFDPTTRRAADTVTHHIDVELSPVWTHGACRVRPQGRLIKWR
ncbi:hypothetical protein M3B90_03590 [Dermabacter sp. p3-SID358]|nr:hypothetical protein [Dermabacter sp. p3-SID358]MCT1866608.1 hypothetical protein [Dermabacter sp. p3-SID358]